MGVALIGAAGVSALLKPRAEDIQLSGEARPGDLSSGARGPELAGLATAIVLAAAAAIERPASAAARIVRDAQRTAVGVARLSPLRRPIDDARSRVEAMAERGRAEGEAGVERVRQAWEALLGQIVGEVLRHIDFADLIETVDVDAVVARVDVERIVDRIDVERIVDRIDVDAVAEHIDLEAIVRRLDLASIASEVLDEIEVEDIIRESSGTLAVQTVDALRERGADADRRLAHFVDRLLLRKHDRDVRLADGHAAHAGASLAQEAGEGEPT